MDKRRGTEIKWTRDLFVSAAATFVLIYEATIGGGRPAVLTACVSLLLSPLIMRVDEARKKDKDKDVRDEVDSGG